MIGGVRCAKALHIVGVISNRVRARRPIRDRDLNRISVEPGNPHGDIHQVRVGTFEAKLVFDRLGRVSQHCEKQERGGANHLGIMTE